MRTSRLLACAQVWITVLILLAFFGLIFLIVLRQSDMTVLKDMVALLMPLITPAVYFWFQRTRPRSEDDPNASDPDPMTPAPPANPINPQEK